MDRGESFSKVGAVVPLVDNTPGTHTRLPVATPFELKGLRPHGDFGTKSGIQEESKNDAVNSVNLSRRGRTHMSTQNGRRQRADSLLDSLTLVQQESYAELLRKLDRMEPLKFFNSSPQLLEHFDDLISKADSPPDTLHRRLYCLLALKYGDLQALMKLLNWSLEGEMEIPAAIMHDLQSYFPLLRAAPLSSDDSCTACWVHDPIAEKNGDSSTQQKNHRRSVACLKGYLFVHGEYGLAKIGLGWEGSQRGRVYEKNKTFRCQEKGSLLVAGDPRVLLYSSEELRSSGKLFVEIDIHTLTETGRGCHIPAELLFSASGPSPTLSHSASETAHSRALSPSDSRRFPSSLAEFTHLSSNGSSVFVVAESADSPSGFSVYTVAVDSAAQTIRATVINTSSLPEHWIPEFQAQPRLITVWPRGQWLWDLNLRPVGQEVGAEVSCFEGQRMRDGGSYCDPGPAERDGRIQVGHRLVEINGQNVEDLSFVKILGLLRSAFGMNHRSQDSSGATEAKSSAESGESANPVTLVFSTPRGDERPRQSRFSRTRKELPQSLLLALPGQISFLSANNAPFEAEMQKFRRAVPFARSFRLGDTNIEHIGDSPIAPLVRTCGRESSMFGSPLSAYPTPSPAAFSSAHFGITCDSCETSVTGPRYHDEAAFNFDLCHECYTRGAGDTSHPFSLKEVSDGPSVQLPPRDAADSTSETRLSDWRNQLPTSVVFDAESELIITYFGGINMVQLWETPSSLVPLTTPPAGLPKEFVIMLDQLGQIAKMMLSKPGFPLALRPPSHISPVSARSWRSGAELLIPTPDYFEEVALASDDGWTGAPVYRHIITGKVVQEIDFQLPMSSEGSLGSDENSTHSGLPVKSLRTIQVRAGPSLSSAVIGRVPLGTCFRVSARRGEWLRLCSDAQSFLDSSASEAWHREETLPDETDGGETDVSRGFRGARAMLQILSHSIRRLGGRARSPDAIPDTPSNSRAATPVASCPDMWVLQRSLTWPESDTNMAGEESVDLLDTVPVVSWHVSPLANSRLQGMSNGSGYSEAQASLINNLYGAGGPRWNGSNALLVGMRIEVLWARGKWYAGTVKSFDGAKHRVLYDDGDERKYRMQEKTFRILGPPDASQGARNSASQDPTLQLTSWEPGALTLPHVPYPPPRAPYVIDVTRDGFTMHSLLNLLSTVRIEFERVRESTPAASAYLFPSICSVLDLVQLNLKALLGCVTSDHSEERDSPVTDLRPVSPTPEYDAETCYIRAVSCHQSGQLAQAYAYAIGGWKASGGVKFSFLLARILVAAELFEPALAWMARTAVDGVAESPHTEALLFPVLLGEFRSFSSDERFAELLRYLYRRRWEHEKQRIAGSEKTLMLSSVQVPLWAQSALDILNWHPTASIASFSTLRSLSSLEEVKSLVVSGSKTLIEDIPWSDEASSEQETMSRKRSFDSGTSSSQSGSTPELTRWRQRLSHELVRLTSIDAPDVQGSGQMYDILRIRQKSMRVLLEGLPVLCRCPDSLLQMIRSAILNVDENPGHVTSILSVLFDAISSSPLLEARFNAIAHQHSVLIGLSTATCSKLQLCVDKAAASDSSGAYMDACKLLRRLILWLLRLTKTGTSSAFSAISMGILRVGVEVTESLKEKPNQHVILSYQFGVCQLLKHVYQSLLHPSSVCFLLESESSQQWIELTARFIAGGSHLLQSLSDNGAEEKSVTPLSKVITASCAHFNMLVERGFAPKVTEVSRSGQAHLLHPLFRNGLEHGDAKMMGGVDTESVIQKLHKAPTSLPQGLYNHLRATVVEVVLHHFSNRDGGGIESVIDGLNSALRSADTVVSNMLKAERILAKEVESLGSLLLVQEKHITERAEKLLSDNTTSTVLKDYLYDPDNSLPKLPTQLLLECEILQRWFVLKASGSSEKPTTRPEDADTPMDTTSTDDAAVNALHQLVTRNRRILLSFSPCSSAESDAGLISQCATAVYARLPPGLAEEVAHRQDLLKRRTFLLESLTRLLKLPQLKLFQSKLLLGLGSAFRGEYYLSALSSHHPLRPVTSISSNRPSAASGKGCYPHHQNQAFGEALDADRLFCPLAGMFAARTMNGAVEAIVPVRFATRYPMSVLNFADGGSSDGFQPLVQAWGGFLDILFNLTAATDVPELTLTAVDISCQFVSPDTADVQLSSTVIGHLSRLTNPTSAPSSALESSKKPFVLNSYSHDWDATLIASSVPNAASSFFQISLKSALASLHTARVNPTEGFPGRLLNAVAAGLNATAASWRSVQGQEEESKAEAFAVEHKDEEMTDKQSTPSFDEDAVFSLLCLMNEHANQETIIRWFMHSHDGAHNMFQALIDMIDTNCAHCTSRVKYQAISLLGKLAQSVQPSQLNDLKLNMHAHGSSTQQAAAGIVASLLSMAGKDLDLKTTVAAAPQRGLLPFLRILESSMHGKSPFLLASSIHGGCGLFLGFSPSPAYNADRSGDETFCTLHVVAVNATSTERRLNVDIRVLPSMVSGMFVSNVAAARFDGNKSNKLSFVHTVPANEGVVLTEYVFRLSVFPYTTSEVPNLVTQWALESEEEALPAAAKKPPLKRTTSTPLPQEVDESDGASATRLFEAEYQRARQQRSGPNAAAEPTRLPTSITNFLNRSRRSGAPPDRQEGRQREPEEGSGAGAGAGDVGDHDTSPLGLRSGRFAEISGASDGGAPHRGLLETLLGARGDTASSEQTEPRRGSFLRTTSFASSDADMEDEAQEPSSPSARGLGFPLAAAVSEATRPRAVSPEAGSDAPHAGSSWEMPMLSLDTPRVHDAAVPPPSGRRFTPSTTSRGSPSSSRRLLNSIERIGDISRDVLQSVRQIRESPGLGASYSLYSSQPPPSSAGQPHSPEPSLTNPSQEYILFVRLPASVKKGETAVAVFATSIVDCLSSHEFSRVERERLREKVIEYASRGEDPVLFQGNLQRCTSPGHALAAGGFKVLISARSPGMSITRNKTMPDSFETLPVSPAGLALVSYNAVSALRKLLAIAPNGSDTWKPLVLQALMDVWSRLPGGGGSPASATERGALMVLSTPMDFLVDVGSPVVIPHGLMESMVETISSETYDSYPYVRLLHHFYDTDTKSSIPSLSSPLASLPSITGTVVDVDHHDGTAVVFCQEKGRPPALVYVYVSSLLPQVSALLRSLQGQGSNQSQTLPTFAAPLCCGTEDLHESTKGLLQLYSSFPRPALEAGVSFLQSVSAKQQSNASSRSLSPSSVFTYSRVVSTLYYALLLSNRTSWSDTFKSTLAESLHNISIAHVDVVPEDLTQLQARVHQSALSLSSQRAFRSQHLPDPTPQSSARETSDRPTDVDEESCWHCMLLDLTVPIAEQEDPTSRIPRSVRFSSFLRREDDPRRCERTHGRSSEEVVLVANHPVPLSSPQYYFEVVIDSAERSGRSAPAVAVGLWADTPLTRGLDGCEWGKGCVAYYGTDGTKADWKDFPSTMQSSSSSPWAPPQEIAFEKGEPVDVKDTMGPIQWRPGTILQTTESTIHVHYWGWDDKWDEKSLARDSDRLAPIRRQTMGGPVPGFMKREKYGSVYGSSGDVIGCFYDIMRGEVSFTLNGIPQGVAFTGVGGTLYPAVAVTNPTVQVHFNFGGERFKWQPPQRPWLSGQPPQSLLADKARIDEERKTRAQDVAAAKEGMSRRQLLPKACPCWKYRANAQELSDFVPGMGLGVLMRVLNMTNNDKHAAAELLLANMESIPVNEENSTETVECRKYAHAFLVENGEETPIDMTTALFGGPVPYSPGLTARYVLAEPPHGDGPLENKDAVAGNIVLIKRGQCTFVQKARNAQNAGAAALVIMSDSEATFVPDGGAENTSDITIPVIMVPKPRGQFLLARCDASGQSQDGIALTLKVGIDPRVDDDHSPEPAGAVADSSAADVAMEEPGSEKKEEAAAPVPAQVARSETFKEFSPRNSSTLSRGIRGGVLGDESFASLTYDSLRSGSDLGRGSSHASPRRDPAEDAWLTDVESRLQGRVARPILSQVMQRLRAGGENNLAIVRTMLEDVDVDIPPRPAPSTPTLRAMGTPGSSGPQALGSPSGSGARRRRRNSDAQPAASEEPQNRTTLADLFAGMPVEVLVSQAELNEWRQANQTPGKARLPVGTAVRAQWSGGGWYDGKIVGYNSDNTYSVHYADGDKDSWVPLERIRVFGSDGSLQSPVLNQTARPLWSHLQYTWVAEMDQVAGQIGEVIEIDESAGIVKVLFDDPLLNSQGAWWFPPELLRESPSLLPHPRGEFPISPRERARCIAEGRENPDASACYQSAETNLLACLARESLALLVADRLQLGSEPPKFDWNTLSAVITTSTDTASFTIPATSVYGHPLLRGIHDNINTFLLKFPTLIPQLYLSSTEHIERFAVEVSSEKDEYKLRPQQPFLLSIGSQDLPPAALVMTFPAKAVLPSSGTALMVQCEPQEGSGLLRVLTHVPSDSPTAATQRAAMLEPLVISGSSVWLRRLGKVSYKMHVAPVSPHLYSAFWLTRVLLKSLSRASTSTRFVAEVVVPILASLFKFVLTPDVPSPLRCHSLQILAGLVRSLPVESAGPALNNEVGSMFEQLQKEIACLIAEEGLEVGNENQASPLLTCLLDLASAVLCRSGTHTSSTSTVERVSKARMASASEQKDTDMSEEGSTEDAMEEKSSEEPMDLWRYLVPLVQAETAITLALASETVSHYALHGRPTSKKVQLPSLYPWEEEVYKDMWRNVSDWETASESIRDVLEVAVSGSAGSTKSLAERGSTEEALRTQVALLLTMLKPWSRSSQLLLVQWVERMVGQTMTGGIQHALEQVTGAVLGYTPTNPMGGRGLRPLIALEAIIEHFYKHSDSICSALKSQYPALEQVSTVELRARLLMLLHLNYYLAQVDRWVPLENGATALSLSRLLYDARHLVISSLKTRFAGAIMSSTSVASPAARPRLTVDRFEALQTWAPGATVFGQAAWQLVAHPAASLRQLRQMPHLAFEIKLLKERVAGESGPYREFFDNAAQELISGSRTKAGVQPTVLPLLQPCPNAKANWGDNREKLLLASNPSGVLPPGLQRGGMSSDSALLRRRALEHGNASIAAASAHLHMRACRGLSFQSSSQTVAAAAAAPPILTWGSGAGGQGEAGGGEMETPTPTKDAPDAAAAKMFGLHEDLFLSQALGETDARALYHALGRMLGACFRTGTKMALALAPVFWRQLAAQSPLLSDFARTDKFLLDSTLKPLLNASKSEFEMALEDVYSYSGFLSDGTEVECFSGGAEEPLRFEDRFLLAEWSLRLRIVEAQRYMRFVEEGFKDVVPQNLVSLLDGRDLEDIICGSPDVDVAMLQQHTRYGMGLTEHHPLAVAFWDTLTNVFSDEERRRFVRFAWGQERLPSTHAEYAANNVRLLLNLKKKEDGASVDRVLPTAQTCFFIVELPEYSTREVLTEQLRKAVNLDCGLDGDDV